MFKFLHAADIHLDSPLRGLDRYDGAPVEEIRGATRRALENLVGVAIEQQVAFVVIAGDVYDGDWPDFNTGLFFVRQMSKLREAGIPVVLISGNHDAENKMTRALELPDNVRRLATRKPESVGGREIGVRVQDCDVRFHGQG
ncbi:MAG: DNA repair exonuclease, partial [Pirellulaceae bacterium]|nr:DNA repair exonuclease [Pirellulaceae bacterium]